MMSDYDFLKSHAFRCWQKAERDILQQSVPDTSLALIV